MQTSQSLKRNSSNNHGSKPTATDLLLNSTTRLPTLQSLMASFPCSQQFLISSFKVVNSINSYQTFVMEIQLLQLIEKSSDTLFIVIVNKL